MQHNVQRETVTRLSWKPGEEGGGGVEMLGGRRVEHTSRCKLEPLIGIAPRND